MGVEALRKVVHAEAREMHSPRQIQKNVSDKPKTPAPLKRAILNGDVSKTVESRPKVASSPSALSSLFVVGALICLSLWGLVYFLDNHITTTPVPATAPLHKFSAERADSLLVDLVQSAFPTKDQLTRKDGNYRLIGRIAGLNSAENTTVEFLLNSIREIQREATEKPTHLEIDISTLEGTTEFFGLKAVYAFKGLTNVAVRVKFPKRKEGIVLCLSAHFDSVVHSPGASDNGGHVAALLEVIRNLINDESLVDTPTPDMIFLFNNGEETGLTGVTGFIQSHAWAREITHVINLDSAGGWGRLFMPQVSRAKGKAHVYGKTAGKNVENLQGSSVGTEIFQSGVIPSGTDFVVFENAGKLGVEFVFIANPWTYHTPLDTINGPYDGYTIEVMQAMGNAYHSTIQSIIETADHESDQSEKEKPQTTFFDVASHFWVSYSKQSADMLCYVSLALLALIFVVRHRSSFLPILLSFSICVISLVLSLSACAAFGWVLSHANTYAWYTNLIHGAFVTISITLTVHVSVFSFLIPRLPGRLAAIPKIRSGSGSTFTELVDQWCERCSQWGVALVHVTLLLVARKYQLATSYVPQIVLLSFLASQIADWALNRRAKSRKLLVFCVWTLPIIPVLAPIASRFMIFIVPTLGRSNIQPGSPIGDVAFFVLCSLCVSVVCLPLVSLLDYRPPTDLSKKDGGESGTAVKSAAVTTTKQKSENGKVRMLLVRMCLLTAILLITAPAYTSARPRRLNIFVENQYANTTCPTIGHCLNTNLAPISRALYLDPASPGSLKHIIDMLPGNWELTHTCNGVFVSGLSRAASRVCLSEGQVSPANHAAPEFEVVRNEMTEEGRWSVGVRIVNKDEDQPSWFLKFNGDGLIGSTVLGRPHHQEGNTGPQWVAFRGTPNSPVDVTLTFAHEIDKVDFELVSNYVVFTPQQWEVSNALPSHVQQWGKATNPGPLISTHRFSVKRPQ